MGIVQGKLGDSGEGEREIPVSVFLFFLLSLSVCPSIILYLFHVSPLMPPTLLSVFYFQLL